MTKSTWNLVEPTDEQVAMTKRVEETVCNEMNLLAREGVPVACILTGLGISIADLLTCQSGPASVAPWFEAQARMIVDLQRGGH